jgi:hypothetical protein
MILWQLKGCKYQNFNESLTIGGIIKIALCPTGFCNKTGLILRNYKVSMPKNFRKETAAQIPILAKKPSATARDIKRTPSFSISLAIFFFIASFSLTNAIPSNSANDPLCERKSRDLF